ncbi:DNA-binding MarR family transcriptional regulator [Halopolyspora algeriensis]|uniref:DNA-binding MarR family transcriptional regulator n=1 Tax=Halopolyspora algeriensis TaxID=1500506 RepID=A0A368W1U2_9ACTN|nr:MarR family winged helix-turn-helix transcriptional regulator [Halopolyspora algeriensis]RCW45958.1 DNA-binding MarR family transcriptional regulator [Halopolyspora algeriensis]TQM55371.1 DNA-binding MarR family transcriptional regulator [Halopolyspora algeriensis]
MSTNHPLAEDLGFLLSRASGVVARSASASLAPLGLRVRSYSVLAFAGEDSAGVTQRRLAALMGLDPSQVVALVDDLESSGLVTRAPDPTDRRNKLIIATEKGHRIREEAQQRVDRAQSGHFDGVPQQHLEQLRSMLRRIAIPEEVPAGSGTESASGAQ